ncbi:hypothetical protein [Ideonella sp.]|uniref:hypothetical protein n=1 Tax=Ideonella sp. TaxID=1929293 RepID=UPI002B4A5CCD|nr:hypothetical protein [Ideonella sp.]HJV71156.1 hypothetical protein [Ideonella sp.]
MKFSQDALLNAAATIVAGQLQARAASQAMAGGDDVSQMLLEAMTQVLGGIDLMEEQAKSESMDLWERFGTSER